uniref:Uncharacterized protein n=1 Tax=Arundo donax TaxID=35708 RepID=A0A0A8Z5S1_ARUDO
MNTWLRNLNRWLLFFTLFRWVKVKGTDVRKKAKQMIN